MANPTLLTSPIAENGDKNVIPASTGATTGLLDQEHGFQQINELPLQAGGLPPQRKDFNGAFNLLSKILFYVQKGYVFDYDENQDYYAGCVVKDTDGGLYCANADVPASSTHPKDDATNWALINYGFTKKETFTSSGSYTAPVTGTYRITLQGGGGGGASGYTDSYRGTASGGGGGQGGHGVFYEKLTEGTSYSFTVGAGGSGGVSSTNYGYGSVGGTSSITINGNLYEANGGLSGSSNKDGSMGGGGGTFTINSVLASRGASGCTGSGGGVSSSSSLTLAGGSGGGEGGGHGHIYMGGDGAFGGGGAGGSTASGLRNGGAGGDGYITFEYCDL